ncbi:hypothetical protein HZB02_01185 [Candidatus Woesearchaeota archaeon]|nr:hypothetical protein [Candidatus Woesearchaeota archaeon]
MEAITPTKYKRESAVKIRIGDLLQGTYLRGGEWEQSSVQLPDGRKIGRVNIIGVLIEKPWVSEKSVDALLDDGTGQILLRDFGGQLSKLNVGAVVAVMGKPRLVQPAFIAIDVVQSVEPGWMEVRKRELNMMNATKNIAPPTPNQQKLIATDSSLGERLLEHLRILDQGDGVLVETLLRELPQEQDLVEEALLALKRQGDIFEVKPGKFKVL